MLSMKFADCACGAKIGVKPCKKRKCEVTKALTHHMIFPTFSMVSECKERYGIFHSAVLGEIHSVRFLYGDVHLHCYTAQDEYFTISLCFSEPRDVTTISYSDIKEGRTIAVLYPQHVVKRNVNRIIVKEPDYCYIFDASLEAVRIEAEKLLHLNDIINRNCDYKECFNCGKASKDLLYCSVCKKSVYCSYACQTVAWAAGHKKLCKQNEVLLRLSCLPRLQSDFDCEKYSFNFREKRRGNIPLPPYAYKHDFFNRKYKHVDYYL